MASTISYAKIVRNQKDDDNIAPQEETNLKEQVPVSKDSSIKSKLLEKDDQSFKEVNNVKKVPLF